MPKGNGAVHARLAHLVERHYDTVEAECSNHSLRTNFSNGLCG
jgi:hypothetical protein